MLKAVDTLGILALLFCFLLHSASAFSSVSLARSCQASRQVALCMAGEGFGAQKKQSSQESIEAISAGSEMIEEKDNNVGDMKEISKVGRSPAEARRRADPVNVDGQAFFDKEWITQSVSTLASEEWRKGAKEGGEYDCPECGGTGRIQGGLATLPGLAWWPIKAFRPCPTCEKAGRSYNRRGQVLDEVLFGKNDMPMDYKRPESSGGLTAEDVKKIMAKRNKGKSQDEK